MGYNYDHTDAITLDEPPTIDARAMRSILLIGYLTAVFWADTCALDPWPPPLLIPTNDSRCQILNFVSNKLKPAAKSCLLCHGLGERASAPRTLQKKRLSITPIHPAHMSESTIHSKTTARKAPTSPQNNRSGILPQITMTNKPTTNHKTRSR